MGAAASVSDHEITRVMKLITDISGDKNDGQLSALKELSKLCDQDDYKIPLIERGKLLPVLVKILSETREISEFQTEAARCCWHLSRTYEARLPIVLEKDMIPTLVSIIRNDLGDARFAALACFVNCANLPKAFDHLLNTAFGLLNVIAMVITTDTNLNNVKMAFWCLAFISKSSWMPDRIDEFLTLNLHVLALNVLKPIGPDPRYWPNRNEAPFYCLSFLTYISAYPEVARLLKSAGAFEVLTPLLVLSEREAINAALIVTFLSGKDESNSQRVSLLQAHPHLTDMLVDLFEAQLSGGKGAVYMVKLGYNFAYYPINMVVRGLLALSISDANKGVLAATRILSLLVQLLQRFYNNAPPVSSDSKVGNSTITSYAGGGGDDIPAATAAIETIVQLTFFFDSDTELIEKFITPKSGVEKLFGDLLELPANRQLDREAKGQIHTLLKRLRPVVISTPTPVLSLAQPEITAIPNSSGSSSGINNKRLHVMMSYAWGAKKELVVALAAALRSLGYDVWRDEEGSAIVPSMSGDTDERMAQAIESSHTVIVCVSPQYKESVNCRSEAQYCKVWKKTHGLNLLYVMMYNEYTTVSKTQTVDGWLGFMVGTELWYPLWSPGNIQSTAIELGKLIGDNARSDGSSTSAPSSPFKTMVTSASSPTMVSSPPPTSVPIAVDYAKAWSIITEPRRVDPEKFEQLSTYLQKQGIIEGDDLEVQKEEVIALIRGYLNPTGQLLFNKAMGI